MKTAAILFLVLALSFAQYSQALCGDCGGTIPKKCGDLLVSDVPCASPSASFSCQKQEIFEGWILCPSCSEGYALASCDSSWLFGLFKTSHCTQNYSVSCGKYCSLEDTVLVRTPCELQKTKKCCEIPTNGVDFVSPLGSNATLYRNESSDFSFFYSGTVKNVSIDYGDGYMEWKSPNVNNFISSSHTYAYTGEYQVIVKAYSCMNCSYQYVSNSTQNVTVLFKRP
ncbi:Uncharacterised protein [uncultured archaeon]|nr:Uncharacterised protein [uncultured archaeon]